MNGQTGQDAIHGSDRKDSACFGAHSPAMDALQSPPLGMQDNLLKLSLYN